MSCFNWLELVGVIVTAVVSYFAGHKVGSKSSSNE